MVGAAAHTVSGCLPTQMFLAISEPMCWHGGLWREPGHPVSDLSKLLCKWLPASVAALKANQKHSMYPKWAKWWVCSPRHSKILCIDPHMPSQTLFHIITSRPCQATSILTQLHTGRVALQLFLKKIKATESALCPHCISPESVAHFLLHCHRYTSQQCKLRYKVSIAATSISWLLSDEKVIPHTLNYIADTRHFGHYLDVGSQDQES